MVWPLGKSCYPGRKGEGLSISGGDLSEETFREVFDMKQKKKRSRESKKIGGRREKTEEGLGGFAEKGNLKSIYDNIQ